MANLFEKKDRHLIPNWRSFDNSAKLGELNGSKGIKLDSTFKPDISDLVSDWQESKSIGVAGDILGVALVCNQEGNETVREISKYILDNKHLASNAIINAAENILKPKKEQIKLNPDISTPDTFNDESNLIEIFLKINKLKASLINNAYNPINWVEIARYYSILGQEKKAERAIKNALFLSSENRFILRSAARFFAHLGDLEYAHKIIQNSELSRHDPWLIATEIALATLREKKSKFAKLGEQIIKSNNFHPFNITELAGSLATLELKNASFQKSKKLFKKSLINPNDNSLAQAEWISQEEKILSPINLEQFKLINSFEASAIDLAEKENWQESIEFSKKWFFDLPFSRRAVLFGNEIAFNKLKDNNQAVEIAKLGLLSHPNDAHLLNNIIYSLCLQNKLSEAEKYLKEVKKEDLFSKNTIGICLTATRGLYNFRNGNRELGRKLYIESMMISKEKEDLYLNSLALVNYIREEILLNEKDVSNIIPNLEKIEKHFEGKDLARDAEEIIELYEKSKTTNFSKPLLHLP